MTNGQEKARENLVAFQRWTAAKTDDDLKQIVFRGRLNRGEVVACGERAEPSIEIEATSVFLIEADLFCRRDSGRLSTLRSQSEHSGE